MPTNVDLINNGQRFLYEPYRTDPGRDDPNSGFGDCSGGVEKTYLITVGTYIGDLGHTSSSIYDKCRDLGLEVPGGFDQAIDIPGTVLFCPENPDFGIGPDGHVGYVGFNRTTLEWTPPMCQSLSVYYQPWSHAHAVFLPGIDYTGHGGPSTSPSRHGALMLIADKTTGIYWLLGPGKAARIDAPRKLDRLRYIGTPDAGVADSLVVIDWMMTFQAWDTATNAPII